MDPSTFSCNDCGNVWNSRGISKRCPKCDKKNISSKPAECRVCLQCDFRWVKTSRSEHPTICPSCKTRNWDKECNKITCKYCDASVPETSIMAHHRRCDNSITEYDKIRKVLSFDYLNNKINVEGISANAIAKSFNSDLIHASQVINLAKSLGITTKTSSETCHLESVKSRKEATYLERYGDTNPLGGKSSLVAVRNKTVRDKYGVDNVFQLDDVKEKMKITYLEKYGVDFVGQVKEIRDRSIATVEAKIGMPWSLYMLRCQTLSGRITKPHVAVESILREMNIEFIREPENLFASSRASKTNSKQYFYLPDIYVPSANCVIEIYGDFWHANPEKYKELDILNIGGNKLFAADIWNRDLKRQRDIESLGYKFVICWERDINSDLIALKDRLWKLLKSNQ